MGQMRILLAQPGKLNTVPMGRFVFNALRALGHDVVDFDLSSSWSDKLQDKLGIGKLEFHGSLNRRFRTVVENTRPDVMFAVFGVDFSQDSLEYLRQRNVLRVCWWLNDPFQFKRSLAMAEGYEYLFSNSLGSIDDYRQAGIRHARWLPTACEPSVHRTQLARAEFLCEVCFAGDWSPLREEWCGLLARHFDVKIFGPWKSKLGRNSPLHANLMEGYFSPEEMAVMFSSSKVVLNLHSWFGRWDHGTNPRLFEAAGCGGCQVVDWKQDIPHLFDVQTEVVTYREKTELVGKIRELLESGESRTALAGCAQRRAYAEHTYRDRMKSVLATIGAE